MRSPATATTARPWAGLALLLLPTAVVAVDINVLFLALPELTADLNASAAQQLWIADVYGLVVGVLAVVAGAVGDRFGRRRLLLAGCAGFLLASLMAAFAPSAEVLVAARVLQAVAGATLMPSTLALITDLFPEEGQRGRAIAAWATTQFACASFGPVVGGLMLHRWWWGSVFLLAVPVGVAVLVLGPRLLPERVDPAATSRVDVLGAGLLVAALASAFTAMKSVLPGHGPTSTVLAGLAALLLGAAFVRWQLTAAVPLLDLRVLAHGGLAGTLAAFVLSSVALAGTGFWVSQYLQSDAGLSPVAAAVAFAPLGLGIAAGTQLAARLAAAVPAERLVPAGLLLAAAGAAGVTLAAGSLPALALTLALVGTGCGPLFALGTHRVVSAVPTAAAGRAAALAETGNHLGAALGIALVGTLGRISSDGIASGDGSLAGSLDVAGWTAALLLGACAALTARRSPLQQSDS